MIQSIHHIGIFTNDPQALITFYTEKLGFSQQATKTVSSAIMEPVFGLAATCSLTKLVLNVIVIEIISPEHGTLKEMGQNTSGYNHWGLQVPEKARYCQALEKKGIHVIRIEKNGGYVAFIKDPDGNLIEIYEAKEGIKK